MAGDAPYLMVLMTDIPWQEENKEYEAVLTELAGYLDQAHEEVFFPATPEPEQTEPVSVSQVPEQRKKSQSEFRQQYGSAWRFFWRAEVFSLSG